jgi:hypothetical protein
MIEGLPPYAARELVAERLPLIFPDGIPNRVYCTRELAASTVFAALYIGAVEGSGRFLGPIHVYRMTSERASEAGDEARRNYAEAIKARKPVEGKRWYADNTREPIRDETLRDGLVSIGAVVRRDDVATTSGLPRYALKVDFAALFDPGLVAADLAAAIGRYHLAHLSKAALARVSIMLAGAAAGVAGVRVTFPSGETRQLAPGPSSVIAQAVVEVFAKRFLAHPAVLWLSESGARVVHRDDTLARRIGLEIEADKNLPDLILADLADDILLVFVEVVATDGAMHARRRAAIHALTDPAGFDRSQVALVTAYRDRQSPGFKKTVAELAWGSVAWFVSEPDHLVVLHDREARPASLRQLLALA